MTELKNKLLHVFRVAALSLSIFVPFLITAIMKASDNIFSELSILDSLPVLILF